ncbi:MAG TPA: hypothetical protein VN805_07945 [Caulobacteraceae bacterium]|nr:hypothetical protein [Caulobacteraceae bacterium]
MTENEILGAVRRFEWRRKVGLAAILTGAVFAGAVAVQFVPGDPNHFTLVEFLAVGATAAILLVGGLVLMRLGRIPAEARTPRIAMLRAERLQTRRRLAFMLMPLSLVFMLPATVTAAAHVAAGRPITHIDLFTAAAFTAFSLAFALMIAGRGMNNWAKPVLDDELSRELRSRALAAGYAVVLTGVAAVFVLAFVSRSLAVELIPVVAALGVAAPAIRLFMLERAAAAGGEEG